MRGPEGVQNRSARDGARYADLFDRAPVGYVTISESGMVLHANATAATLLGVTLDDLLRQPLSRFVHADDVGHFHHQRAELFAIGELRACELRIVRGDGTSFWAHLAATFAPHDGDAEPECRVVLVDMSARRQAEATQRDIEERYRRIVETAEEGIWTIDAASCTDFVNPKMARMLGYEAEEMLGCPLTDFMDEEGRALAAHNVQRRQQGIAEQHEFKFRRKDGTELWTSLVTNPISNALGEYAGALAMVTDITERKLAEVALRESEERFRAMFEQAAVGVAMVDSNTGRFLSVNQRACDIARLTREQMLRSTFMDITHPDDLRTDLDKMEQLKAGALQSFTMEKRYLHADGAITWVNLTVSPMWLHGDAPTRHVAVVEDITGRKDAERALQESEEKFRTLFENAGDAIFLLDGERFADCNARALETFGCRSRDEFVEHPPYEFSPRVQPDGRESRESAREKLAGALAGRPQYFEWMHTKADGTLFPAEVSLNAVNFGEQSLLQGIVRDISERKKAEEALEHSEERFRTLTENAPILTYLTDERGDCVYVNRRWSEASGLTLEEAQGQGWLNGLHEDDRETIGERWKQSVASGGTWGFEYRFKNKDGRVTWVYGTAAPITAASGKVMGHVGTNVDITERRQAQREREQFERTMQETQKLESLGVLAGGIAHDFNNLLTGILGNVSLASLDAPADSALHTYLDSINEGSLRAADLCKQMLAYSGRGRFVVQPLDVGQLVRETAQMLRISISKKALLRFHLEHGLPPVEADATQLRQVIMNLVINASEAIGDTSGVISLATGLARVDRAYLSGTLLAPELPEGEYVFLEVADSGSGMDAETQARIFDPFFTTKFAGRGLGLAAVLGIVRGHKGAVKVESAVGRGTTFRLLFPTISGSAHAPKASLPDVVRWKGRGDVLVVDDEETVRTVAARMLPLAGFNAVLVSDGREAVPLVRADPARFAAVLLDLTMPHMGGEETFVALQTLRADLPVVLMSGYDQPDALVRFPGKRPASFLQKPFNMETLRAVLKSVVE